MKANGFYIQLVVISFSLLTLLPSAASASPVPLNPCTFVNPSSSQQITGPDGVCKKVTNNNAANKLCVMTGTTAQWQSFYNNPNGATVAACAAACGGTSVGGYCWYVGNIGDSCDTACSGHGGCNFNGTNDYVGDSGTTDNCTSVINAMGLGPIAVEAGATNPKAGCARVPSVPDRGIRVTGGASYCNISWSYWQRVCACNN